MSTFSLHELDVARHLIYKADNIEVAGVFRLLLKAGYTPEIKTLPRMCILELSAKKIIRKEIKTLAYLDVVLSESAAEEGPVIIASVHCTLENRFLFTKKK